MDSVKISLKVVRIIHFFFICLIAILLRLWYLSVILHENAARDAKIPSTRTVFEKPARGTIWDRFGMPLALNAPQYNAAICYEGIRSIPRIQWEKGENGKKRKVYFRKKYIEELSLFLGEAFHLDPLDIQDIIHGQASLFPHTSFLIAEDIPEELYYRLKGAQRNWPGLEMQQSKKRIYPQGKVGCDVIGYVGSISPQEYFNIESEVARLQSYLREHSLGQAAPLPKGFSSYEQIEIRLRELEEKSYTLNDLIGKSGIEAAFDEKLRGSIGKIIYEVDQTGSFLQKISEERQARAGEKIVLTLSSELQKEAERLLIESELTQDLRDEKKNKLRRHPWIRGGAIVALHPRTGEILALASHPRFDPNDFIPYQTPAKRNQTKGAILQWLESLSYIGELWDGKRELTRELFSEGQFKEDSVFLSWDYYLDTILDKESSVMKCIKKIDTLQKAIQLDEKILEEIPWERDQFLFLDLLSLAVPKEHFTESLLLCVGDQTICEFRLFSQMAAQEMEKLKKQAVLQFEQREFREWRETHFKDYLKEKRKKEKEQGKYAKPYTEYLRQIKNQMFEVYWNKHRLELLYQALESSPLFSPLKNLLLPLEKEDKMAYLKSLQSFEDLTKPLRGKYPFLRGEQGKQIQKHLAAAFYPYHGLGFGCSHSFRQASPMGSIFKIVPAYASLIQKYKQGATDLNPLTIIDDMQNSPFKGSNSQILGYWKNGEPIRRLYKGGRLPGGFLNIGEVNLQSAIERSSNLYFSLLAGDILAGPTSLLETAKAFGLGIKTGVDLPGEYPGILPNDLLYNKSGLYSFAIGQHSLVVTPLQSALLFSSIVNGGKILRPKIIQDFAPPTVRQTVEMPSEIYNYLLLGMHKVVNGERGTARPARMPRFLFPKELIQNYRTLAPQIVGKTGTAEILYKQTVDAETPAELEKHVWFAAISFEEERLQEPELVVIVYSRFGSSGTQGAPLAAKMVQKWREIKKQYPTYFQK